MAFSLGSLFGGRNKSVSPGAYRLLREHRQRAFSTVADGERVAIDSSYATDPARSIATIVPKATSIDRALLDVYHLIRENIPIIDAAIRNRRTLEGHPVIWAEDEGLAEYLNEVCREMPVGYLGESATLRGMHRITNAISEAADEYGFGGAESQLEESGRGIKRVVVPTPRNFRLGTMNDAGQYPIFYRDPKIAREERVDNLPTWSFLSFNYSTDSIWPVPLAWSLLKNSEIMLRAVAAVAIAWWRYGDPPQLFGLEYDKDANPKTTVIQGDEDAQSVEVPVAMEQLLAAAKGAYADRLAGKVSDMFTWIKGGSVKVQSIGDVRDTLARYYREQMEYHDALVVSLSDTPRWMYPQLQNRGEGMGSNLSQNEALIASTAAERRQAERNRVVRRILDLHLVLSGEARYVGQYEVRNEAASLIDDKVQAETAKVAAEAEAQVIENTALLYNEDGSPRFSGPALEYYQSQTTTDEG